MISKNAKRDSEIVERAIKGDQRVFEQLMDRYSRIILYEINLKVKNKEVANDLMMESMEKAFEKLESYDQ